MKTSSNAAKGVLFVCAAVFLFALSDVIGKHLVTLYPVQAVAAVRYGINVVLLGLLLWPKHREALWRTRKTWLVVARGVCLAAATYTMGLALRLMPVSDTVAILYMSPFAVMVLAVPLLGEKVRFAGWIGAIAGFLGVLIVMRPGSGLNPAGVAIALVNAALATCYALLTRYLTRSETTIAMLFHTALVGAIVFAGMSLVTVKDFAPAAMDMGLMALLGVIATIAHVLFTAAYREAQASLLAPINYLHLVWAAILGWLAFGHIPDQWSLAGMAMIVLAGAGIAIEAHCASRARPS
jgi:drug/metabolite transporter (DMT)-like permease